MLTFIPKSEGYNSSNDVTSWLLSYMNSDLFPWKDIILIVLSVSKRIFGRQSSMATWLPHRASCTGAGVLGYPEDFTMMVSNVRTKTVIPL